MPSDRTAATRAFCWRCGTNRVAPAEDGYSLCGSCRRKLSAERQESYRRLPAPPQIGRVPRQLGPEAPG